MPPAALSSGPVERNCSEFISALGRYADVVQLTVSSPPVANDPERTSPSYLSGALSQPQPACRLRHCGSLL